MSCISSTLRHFPAPSDTQTVFSHVRPIKQMGAGAGKGAFEGLVEHMWTWNSSLDAEASLDPAMESNRSRCLSSLFYYSPCEAVWQLYIKCQMSELCTSAWILWNPLEHVSSQSKPLKKKQKENPHLHRGICLKIHFRSVFRHARMRFWLTACQAFTNMSKACLRSSNAVEATFSQRRLPSAILWFSARW